MNDLPASPEAIALVRDLIALAVDPAACRTRLEKLQKQIDKAAEAVAKLEERQTAFDAKVVQQHAELDERKAALATRALQLSHREAAAEQIIARDRANRLDRSRPLAGGMTITQEQT